MNSQILMLLKFNLQFLNKEQNFEYLNLNQYSQDLSDILKMIINDIINNINQEEVYNIITDSTTKQYQHIKSNFDKKSSNRSIPMILFITNPGCDTKLIITENRLSIFKTALLEFIQMKWLYQIIQSMTSLISSI